MPPFSSLEGIEIIVFLKANDPINPCFLVPREYKKNLMASDSLARTCDLG
jgi:hypothetical protein